MLKTAALAVWGACSFVAAEGESAAPGAGDAGGRAAEDFFEAKVRPVLVENCVSCHGEEKQKAELRLDSRERLLKGSETGPVVVPGEPRKSRLIEAIHYRGEVLMPPKGKLPIAAIEAIEEWVKLGAPWPASPAIRGEKRPSAPGTTPPGAESVATHWAFKPLRRPTLPIVKDSSWARSDLDLFALAAMEENGLTPAPEADPATLIRRVSVGLTGIRPTFDEIEEFEGDARIDSFDRGYDRLIERLLASRRYGERWGRHWLDIARYSDTKGYVFQEERLYPYSYTYRDYVIEAFNRDLPYDRFIREQLAADLLPLGDDRRPLAAMGFLTLGRRFLNNTADIIDDRIDVVTRGFLGLTVTCARCHDHKYDPIPSRDYYSLYGVFASSFEPKDPPEIGPPAHGAEYRAYLAELQKREDEVARNLEAKEREMTDDFRARAGEYLIAIATRRAGEDRAEEKPNSNLAAGELNRQVLRRWRSFLDEKAKEHDPIFAPWFLLSRIEEKEFPAKSVEMLGIWASATDSARRIHPLVAKTLAERPLASFRDVAERYGELLAGVEKLWRERRGPNGAAENGARGFEDADQEALRLVLHGSNAPTVIPKGEIERFFNRKQRDEVRNLRRKVDNLKATAPGAPPRAMVLQESSSPYEPRVFIRGNPGNPGASVPRQFLEVLAGAERKPFQKGSGRLELAEAIASKENPLTARVMVNRIWLQHFGTGLVNTPSDFGLRSESPVHRELLDTLAWHFIESGWSIKAVQRLILRSSVYRQESRSENDSGRRDPENRLLSRAGRFRLDFEALRDSLLAASGVLDEAMGGRAVDITSSPTSRRRTVYGFIDRQNLPGLFRTFDFAIPDTTSPQRFVTTVPQQALFLMNSPFMAEMAKAILARPDVRISEGAAPEGATQAVRRLHRAALGREPTREERSLAIEYLEHGDAGAAGAAGAAGWANYAQALLLTNEFAFVD